jgi:hypothetical protein
MNTPIVLATLVQYPAQLDNNLSHNKQSMHLHVMSATHLTVHSHQLCCSRLSLNMNLPILNTLHAPWFTQSRVKQFPATKN